MGWVYCNKCFRIQSDCLRLVFTTCKHVFCDKCLQENNQCTICNKSVKAIEINKSMPPHINYYFHDIIGSGQKLQETIKFQFEQLNSYIRPNVAVFEKLKIVKSENQKLEEESSRLVKEIENEHREIQQLRQKISHRKRVYQYMMWKRKLAEQPIQSRNDITFSPCNKILANRSTPVSNVDRKFPEQLSFNNLSGYSLPSSISNFHNTKMASSFDSSAIKRAAVVTRASSFYNSNINRPRSNPDTGFRRKLPSDFLSRARYDHFYNFSK